LIKETNAKQIFELCKDLNFVDCDIMETLFQLKKNEIISIATDLLQKLSNPKKLKLNLSCSNSEKPQTTDEKFSSSSLASCILNSRNIKQENESSSDESIDLRDLFNDTEDISLPEKVLKQFKRLRWTYHKTKKRVMQGHNTQLEYPRNIHDFLDHTNRDLVYESPKYGLRRIRYNIF